MHVLAILHACTTGKLYACATIVVHACIMFCRAHILRRGASSGARTHSLAQTEYNTGNAVHYGLLAVKALKASECDKFDLLSAKYQLFCRARMLHPKRLIEQSMRFIEQLLEEVQVHVAIDANVTITIWHVKSQAYRPGSATKARIVFDKLRCWQLASDSEAILTIADPECFKLDMSAESKVKGFLRSVGLGHEHGMS